MVCFRNGDCNYSHHFCNTATWTAFIYYNVFQVLGKNDTVKPLIYAALQWAIKLLIIQMLQLHLHSQFNTWHQWIGQRQLQDERETLTFLFGVPYIRGLTLYIYNLSLSYLCLNFSVYMLVLLAVTVYSTNNTINPDLDKARRAAAKIINMIETKSKLYTPTQNKQVWHI